MIARLLQHFGSAPVDLKSAMVDSGGFIRKLKMYNFSNVQKVFAGWAVIIAMGLGAFVLAKKDVDSRRYQMYNAQKAIREATRDEDYDAQRTYRGLLDRPPVQQPVQSA